MKSYSAADVARILKVKIHVIRYWERVIPLIQPSKDTQGKCFYSGKDLQILMRLKYLLYEKRFTIEGAKDQLYYELSGARQDIRAQIASMRSALIDLYLLVKDL